MVSSGTGKTQVVPVPGPQSTATGREVRYDLEVEGGLGIDTSQLARTVHQVLLDGRGWQTKDHLRFVNLSPAQMSSVAHVDLHIVLASPRMTDRLCAPLNTAGETSCYNGRGAVVLNARRWVVGAKTYGTDLADYRIYLVNHEVGHGIGHFHVHCTGPGDRAPVMLQQTLRLEGCKPWPWPTGTKPGARPAPG